MFNCNNYKSISALFKSYSSEGLEEGRELPPYPPPPKKQLLGSNLLSCTVIHPHFSSITPSLQSFLVLLFFSLFAAL